MIPLVDLKAQYASLRGAIEQAMADVGSSGAYILGPQVEEFERRFADYIGVSEGVGVANGTDALRLACQALGVGSGHEVLVPANTFIASAIAVRDAGAVPVPVDAVEGTYLMSLSEAERRLTPRTRALMPVHLYGQTVDMTAVMSFAERHGLVVIEDACQSHGAKWQGRCAGSFGHAGCFSFYPAKNLGALGDGGMVVTNDRVVAERIRMLRNYGSARKNVHEAAGTNSRLDTLQAAILLVKIGHLDAWNRRRFEVACRYRELLGNVGSIRLPEFDATDPARHVFHLFVIQCEGRDALLEHLGRAGIQCGIHYPLPFYRQKAFVTLNRKSGDCPQSESMAGRILSLPMYPEIKDEQILNIAEQINRFYERVPA